jgi:DNA-binding transcriptional LysR family regulator
MEMHQVRYFLAVARTRNFTRAAEECFVAQPLLTRAIRQLEAELGGDLFRRERPQAQLTELGQRMLPLLQQCYDSALGAKSLASSMKRGDIASLRVAISRSIDCGLFVPHLRELSRHFRGLDLKVLRGTAAEAAELLKAGDAELGIVAELNDSWDRFDRWPLFSERFDLLVSARHKLANRDAIEIGELRQERFLTRTYCEHAGEIAQLLHSAEINVERTHQLTCERDLMQMLEAGFGVAIVPSSSSRFPSLLRVSIMGLDLQRTVYLYGVAGRERTPVASAAMKLLRACNWSKALN